MKKLLVLAAMVAIAAPGFAASTDTETVNLEAVVQSYVDISMNPVVPINIDPSAASIPTFSLNGTVITNALDGVKVSLPASVQLGGVNPLNTAQLQVDFSGMGFTTNGVNIEQNYAYNAAGSAVTLTGTPVSSTTTPADTYTGSVTLTATAI